MTDQPSSQPDISPDSMTHAKDMEEAGDVPAAIEILRRGLRAAVRDGDLRTPAGLANYARLSVALTNLVIRAGDPQAGLRLVADLRDRFREAGYARSELAVLVELVSAYEQRGDLETAAGYAKEIFNVWPLNAGSEIAGWEAPSAQGLSSIILRVAYSAYYVEENYERTAALAEMGVLVDPGSWIGFWLLGFAHLRLGKFSESIDAFDRAVSLDTDNVRNTSTQTGRAAAFQGLGRLDDAIAAITEAITLVPDRPRYWWSRAVLQVAAGQHELALADLDQTIVLAGRAAESSTGDSREFRSSAEYMREFPAGDLRDVALLRRLEELWVLGRAEDALQEATVLTAQGSDGETRGAAQYLIATWYLERGEQELAEPAFTAAVDADIQVAGALLGRARCRIALGQIDDALTDLDTLCGQDSDRHDPSGAAEVLSMLLDRHPEMSDARQILGHALLEDWRPAQAIAELDKVLTDQPGNWQALLWRGLARITHSGGPTREEGETDDDRLWNESLNLDRIWQAVTDLVAAVQAAAPGEGPIKELLWLAQRVIWIDEIETRLIFEASSGFGVGFALTEIIPALKPVFRRMMMAAGLSPDWTEMAVQLTAAREEANGAEMPILTAKLDLLLADALLRTYEIQQALDCIAAAEMMLSRLGEIPAIPSGQQRAAEAADAGRSAISIDIDHLEFSVGVTERFVRYSHILRAEALARTGEPGKALEAVYNLDGLLEQAASGHRKREAIAVIPMLRDSGDYGRALALIRALQPQVGEGHDRERLLSYEVHTYLQMGDMQQAEELLQAELPRAQAGELEGAVALMANLASSLLEKDASRALNLLDAFPPPDTARPEAWEWHVIRGQALLGLDRSGDAVREFITGLDLRDRVRGKLRAEDARISWQATALKFPELCPISGDSTL